MAGWCKPVSSVAVFPRMFSNYASEVGPRSSYLRPSRGRRVEEGAARGAHPADGARGCFAHAVVYAGVVNRCVVLENREINDEPMSAFASRNLKDEG
jgi:hypothetical protein